MRRQKECNKTRKSKLIEYETYTSFYIMNRHKTTGFIIGILLFSVSSFSQSTLAIGGWRTHTNYMTGVDGDRIGNELWYASQTGLVRVQLSDNSIKYIDRVSGLNDIKIQCMRANQQTKTIIICYTNSNIDLYQSGKITNIPDIYTKSISGDKTIYAIFSHDNYAYLSCGFGVVVLDLKRRIVTDSWLFHLNNQSYPVKDLIIVNDSIYVATDHALFASHIDNPYKNNVATWKRIDNVKTPNNNCFKQFTMLHNLFYLMKTDTQTLVISGSTVHKNENVIYRHTPTGWEEDSSFRLQGEELRFIRASSERLLVGTNVGIRSYHINPQTAMLDTTYVYYLAYGAVTAFCGANNSPFLVSSAVGLQYEGTDWLTTYKMPGPAPGAVTAMDWKKSKLVTVHNTTPGWIPVWTLGRLSVLLHGVWEERVPQYNASAFADVIHVVIAPYDTSLVYAASFLGGLLELRNETVVHVYDNTNTALQTMSDGSTRTTSPVFDKNNNLWFGNWGSTTPLFVKMENGKMLPYSIPFTNIEMVEQIMIDSRNILWLVCNKQTRLILLNHNGTPDTKLDDTWISPNISLTEEQGRFTYIYSIVEDKEGKIWLGTDKGIKVYSEFARSKLFENPNTTLPEPIKVTYKGSQDTLTELLLNQETVNCIKVDAGNRKWIGTNNSGVFLFSPDGGSELFHFTTENSPLLSDMILAIEIDGETGEVFFGTDKGLISFRYTATEGKENYDELKIFPNPVRENFDGYISISGLKEQSEVKITDAQGNLIYRTTSNGGTAVWDGRHFNREKASTGVYFVFINDNTGKERKAGKILFIK
jgi:hypothetical protein